MNKLNENEVKELKRITKVIENNGVLTNVGYRIDGCNCTYGKHIIEKGIYLDVDGDKIENNLLYVWLDNEIYKVINEDIEGFEENYFVLSARKNGDEFIENFKSEEEALNYAYSDWNHLTKKEKEENIISVGKGIYEELNGYNPIKTYTYRRK